MTDEQKHFLQLVAGPAIDSERKWQIPASITIAQSILESGWGKSQLFLQANNPFGIKAPVRSQSPDHYEAYEAPTSEYLNHEWEIVSARFMAFSDLQAAFFRHARLLWEPQFKKVQDQLVGDPATRPQRVAQALRDSHPPYATDPDYPAKLMQLVNEFHLDDPNVLASFAPTPPTAHFTPEMFGEA